MDEKDDNTQDLINSLVTTSLSPTGRRAGKANPQLFQTLSSAEAQIRVTREQVLIQEGFGFNAALQQWIHPLSGSRIGMHKLLTSPIDTFLRFLDHSRGDIVVEVDPEKVQDRLDHLVNMARQVHHG